MLVDYWGLSIDRANRGHMLSLSLFDYTDDVMAARDRPIDFSDITGSKRYRRCRCLASPRTLVI